MERKLGKNMTDIIEELRATLEKAQQEVCDDLCRFPRQNRSEEEMRSLCRNCPLNRLD